ncbi:MAG: dadA, partial [Proteobacteria bacterium]|nr:dadA [Pseudomonadota bacterium]
DCRDNLLGGLYAPQDESGDAHKFTQALAALCAVRGVAFRHGTTIAGLVVDGGRVSGVRLNDAGGGVELLRGDAYVLSLGSYSALLAAEIGENLPIYPVKGYSILGSYSALLAAEIGENLPIYPVKGYSITLPLDAAKPAPRISITDESRRIVCSRLGDRLRAAGTAELAGYDSSINETRCRAIVQRVAELFPGLAEGAQPEFWAGLRPATPNNLPVIGRSRYSNLYFNTGHGTLGWTLACGSAAALADIVDGRRPEPVFPFRRL